MKNYYTIGEISKIYDIGRDSLRYYEEIGILNPSRDKNGYRLYKMQDIWKLNVIKDLKNLDFTMKQIKKYLDNRTVDSTKAILNSQMELIDKKIRKLKETKRSMYHRLQNIENAHKDIKLNTMKLIYLEERRALKLNGKVSRDEEVDFLIKKLQKQYEDRLYLFGNNNIGATVSMEYIKKDIYNLYESVFFLLDPWDESYNLILDEGCYLSLTYRGSYEQSKMFIPKMLEYIDNKKYEVLSNPIEIYKIDIHETSCIDEFITEIQIPIRKK